MSHDNGRPIALIGIMGAGKSEVAARLGERLGCSVADLDAMIEAERGCTITQLFDREGESVFRRLERELLDRVLHAGIRVIACGGGIVLDAVARARLHADCNVVWLEVSPAEAAKRVAGDTDLRPLLRGGKPEVRLSELLAARNSWYDEVATMRVATDGRTPDEIALDILARTGAA
jgi:shikimate kinase